MRCSFIIGFDYIILATIDLCQYIFTKKVFTTIASYANIILVIKTSQSKDNFKRGTAELLILHLLQKEDLYGYQITQLFNEKSKGEYTVLEGSLYPVLFRLVDAGYLSEYEQLVGVKRKRRYYHLEEAGKLYYRELLQEFDGIIYAINSILDRTIGYSQNYA